MSVTESSEFEDVPPAPCITNGDKQALAMFSGVKYNIL